MDSKEVPKKYLGKLEANFYCRFWNEKRKKYCKNRAGKGTDHVGSGRCKRHGGEGSHSLVHGRYSKIERSSVKEIKDLLAATDKNPFDLVPDIHMMRALIIDYINRYETMKDALLAWHNSYGEDFLKDYADWAQLVHNAEYRATHGLTHKLIHANSEYNKAYKLWGKECQKLFNDYQEKCIQALENITEHEDLPPAPVLPDPPKPTNYIHVAKTELDIPAQPHPNDYEKKPRRILDKATAVKMLKDVAATVQAADKMLQQGTIKLETLNRVLEQYGIEVSRAAYEEIEDGAIRESFLDEVEKRWGTIRLDPRSSDFRTQGGTKQLN